MSRCVATAVLILALSVVFTATAQAGPFGFGAPTALVSGIQPQQPAIALGANGSAVVAWIADRAIAASVRDPSGTWRPVTVAPTGAYAHDVQAALTAAGDAVVAWAEDQRVMAATAPAGGAFGPAQTIDRVADGSAATPRIAVVSSGSVLLVYRDGQRDHPGALRVAVRTSAAFGAPVAIGYRGSRLALTASGRGAVLAFGAPARRCGTVVHPPRVSCAPRALRAVALDATGRPRGAAITVAPDVTGFARLAAGPGAIVLTSWLRPARDDRPARGATRLLRGAPLLAAGPPRPLPRARVAPTIAVGPHGDALAGFTILRETSGRTGVVVRAKAGAPWREPQELATSGLVLTPRVAVAPSGAAIAVLSVTSTAPTGITDYRLLIAEAAPGRRFAAPEPLAMPSLLLPTTLATLANRMAIVWSGPNGMLIAERG